ncbi:hypothetical protein GCM10010317_097060 [Streptomyces mirabilis]|nr:hypothetical protein GCM10010317_097060 [Streptomyces mirabilis]
MVTLERPSAHALDPEDRAIALLARQQPVATDLRTVVTSLLELGVGAQRHPACGTGGFLLERTPEPRDFAFSPGSRGEDDLLRHEGSVQPGMPSALRPPACQALLVPRSPYEAGVRECMTGGEGDQVDAHASRRQWFSVPLQTSGDCGWCIRMRPLPAVLASYMAWSA